ncbi:family 16 glycosylhydrolase [Tamlana sp. 2_MG-2023]|uniref:family 16 glycosylhydrolase n=1 Tax=unclassified Tamlana TaxID=2614803 RepID=UPI0026E1A62E|nr:MULTISPECIES: family 16 glycosylhydrolase [unclassified Tamlana]MDO6760567.1 family 16 glycosylhydrolase [Tamlana sp. 2_MG-2023]MDO6790823.1 family 16 glycosylhydrolase [Tamlana sp. 1_MG-2023]
MKTINFFTLVLLLFISASYAQQPVGLNGNWDLQPDFSDEFNNGLNTNKWDHNPNDWGPWSWEPRHTVVNNGNLKLTLDWDKHTRGNNELYFTSGIIRSKKDIKYGYFEVKMKGASRHPGVCPAFWTYSIAQDVKVINGKRVKYNEIDFPEIQQRQRNVNLIDWNIIRADDARPQKRTSVRKTTGGGLGPSFDPRNAYHVYGCLWEEDKIEFYIDGVKVATGDPTESVYQKHFQRLVISLGLREPYYEYVNGTRVATETNTKPSGFPTTMHVDYVRTWKRGSGNTGGGGGSSTGCASAWKANATYSVGEEVSYQGKKWNWKSQTPGNCTPGACGRWRDLGTCDSSSGGGAGSTSCAPVWSANGTYSLGDEILYQGKKWNWKSRTPGNCTPVSCGRWRDLGTCSATNKGEATKASDVSNYVGNGVLESEMSEEMKGFGPSGVITIDYNRASKSISIVSDGLATVNVYSLQGAIILKQSFQDDTQLDISHLAQGLYVIQVANDVNSISKKVAIK